MATLIASTTRQRARRVLRPLLVFLLLLRCAAALPPRPAGTFSHVERQGAVGRVLAPVAAAELMVE
jgi:hypothetical protein